MDKISIMFVCHGNICRSPMAEYVMKDIVKKRSIEDMFNIESSAVSSEELGNPVHYGTRRKLSQMGIFCGDHHAVKLKKEDYAKYDYILVMDERNLSRIDYIIHGDPDKKVKRLLDFSDNPRDIADPWYTGNFDETFDDILEGCEALLSHILGGE